MGADKAETKINLETIYLRLIEGAIYVSLFTPLIFVRDFFFPFVSPKTFFFRILIDIIFILFVFLVFTNRKYIPRFKHPLVMAVAVFISFTILTSITGVNFERSFWGNFERGTGILTFLHLFAFFIILTGVFKTRKQWERILTAAVLIGAIESLYVLFFDNLSPQGGGTLGNTSFLTAYLLFPIFFAITLFFVKAKYWKIAYASALVPMLWVLLFPEKELTRGAVGAFFIGVFLMAFFFSLVCQKKFLKRLAFLFLAIVLLAGLGFIKTDIFKEKFAAVTKEVPGESRTVIWGIAWEGIKERPLLGWGQENFNVPFVKYFDPRLPLSMNVWYDRTHNIVLDTLIHGGIVLLLSYLSVFAVAIFGLLKLCPRIRRRQNLFLPLGAATLLITYFLQNLWVFDMIVGYMMFFFALSFVYFLTERRVEKEELLIPKIQPRGIYNFIAPLLVVVSLLILYFGNIQSVRSAVAIVKGLQASPEDSAQLFQRAIQLSPMAQSQAAEQMALKMASGGNQYTVKNMQIASVEIKKAIEANPSVLRLPLFLGRLYNAAYSATGNLAYLQEAELYLNKALELSPKNQQPYSSLAQTRFAQDRREEAIALMQAMIDLEPSLSVSHWSMVLTQKAVGNYREALVHLEEAREQGFRWHQDEDKTNIVVSIYRKMGRNDEAERELLLFSYLKEAKEDPKNAALLLKLAAAYGDVGMFEQARNTVKSALEIDATLTERGEELLSTFSLDEQGAHK